MTPPLKVLNRLDFITDLKAAHKGQGPLRLRGRNPNRKQFYPETDRSRSWHKYLVKSCFQQDLPAKFSTHFAVYATNMAVVRAVINIYKNKGINVLYTA